MEDSDSTAFPLPNLPNDAIVEILTWLPVKPLLKFKCVCKSWRALISSQRFVKSHLHNSKLDRNSTTRRLLMQNPRGNHSTFKQFSANSILSDPVSESFDLISPLQLDGGICGSCNGLLLMAAWIPIPGIDGGEREQLILWNPSTRIFKELPASPDWPRGDTHYGFGYDKSSDDYKVVRFFCDGHDPDVDSSNVKVILQVYSLGNDEWKAVKTVGMQCLHLWQPATFLDGKLYWIGAHSDDPESGDFLVWCFDLETEACETLQMPNCAMRRHTRRCLGESDGSLRVMCFHPSSSDVWRLRDDGKGKWEKVLTFPNYEVSWFVSSVWYVMNVPVVFLANDNGWMGVAIFDAKDCSIRYPEIRNTAGFILCGAYIESLVSPLDSRVGSGSGSGSGSDSDDQRLVS